MCCLDYVWAISAEFCPLQHKNRQECILCHWKCSPALWNVVYVKSCGEFHQRMFFFLFRCSPFFICMVFWCIIKMLVAEQFSWPIKLYVWASKVFLAKSWELSTLVLRSRVRILAQLTNKCYAIILGQNYNCIVPPLISGSYQSRGQVQEKI